MDNDFILSPVFIIAIMSLILMALCRNCHDVFAANARNQLPERSEGQLD
jgi:hypothetical protein